MNNIVGTYIRRSALALAVIGVATSLCAQPARDRSPAAATAAQSEFMSEQVDVAGLDLGSKADQARLKSRIQLAATHVCKFDDFLDRACVDVTTVDGWHQAMDLIHGHVSGGSAAAAIVIVGRPSN